MRTPKNIALGLALSFACVNSHTFVNAAAAPIALENILGNAPIITSTDSTQLVCMTTLMILNSEALRNALANTDMLKVINATPQYFAELLAVAKEGYTSTKNYLNQIGFVSEIDFLMIGLPDHILKEAFQAVSSIQSTQALLECITPDLMAKTLLSMKNTEAKACLTAIPEKEWIKLISGVINHPDESPAFIETESQLLQNNPTYRLIRLAQLTLSASRDLSSLSEEEKSLWHFGGSSRSQEEIDSDKAAIKQAYAKTIATLFYQGYSVPDDVLAA